MDEMARDKARGAQGRDHPPGFQYWAIPKPRRAPQSRPLQPGMQHHSAEQQAGAEAEEEQQGATVWYSVAQSDPEDET
ncbi:hypothetical protein EYF80_004905 [Liparis tanakae]|uniref:Uncharacterized protein n=1 Tax=Liparis tanakae TaxID=230148 RepID=A0A4Z2J3U4_9TELE|nr:hypothetical protein EYF80_004905 [Liparis tanakae]